MPETPDQPGFPLTVAIDAHGGTRRFKTLADYATWIEAEDTATATWRAATAPPVDGGWYQNALNGVREFFKAANDKIGRYQTAANQAVSPSQKEHNLKAIAGQIATLHETHYGAGKVFTSDSSQGWFLSDLAKGSPMLAQGAFVTLRGDEHPESAFGRGLVEGALFWLGIYDRAEAEGEALAALATEWRERFQAAADERAAAFDEKMATAGEDLASEQDALDQLRAEHKAFMEGVRETMRTQVEEVAGTLGDAHTRLENLETTYRQALGLEAPVTYWKKKAVGHRWLAGGAFALVAAAGGAFLWFFLGQVDTLLAPGVDPGTAEVVVLLTLATLGVWAVRIFVRLFFSQVHLTTDARERAVMIETFLALLTSEDATPEERLLVLQTIFRPSATGIVRDEAAPPSVASELSKLLNR